MHLVKAAAACATLCARTAALGASLLFFSEAAAADFAFLGAVETPAAAFVADRGERPSGALHAGRRL